MQKIDLFINAKSQFDVLSSFTDSLHAAFLRAGIQSKEYDFLKVCEDTSCFSKDVPNCTMGFNVYFSSDFFFDTQKIVHVALLVDSASHHKEVLECPNVIPCYFDEDSCHFIEALGMHEVLFFPHAIDRKYLNGIPQGARDLDVVMSASFYDNEEILSKWKKIFSKPLVDLFIEIAERVLASDSISLLQAFSEVISNGNVYEQEIRQKGFQLFDVANSIEHYFRGIERIKMIEAIDEADIHIFSPKSEHMLWKNAVKGKKRLFLHDSVSFEELVDVYKRARVVINSAPMIKRGMHERLLLALSQGASVLTSDNVYIGSHFPFPKAVMRIKSPDYKKANDLIRGVFSDENARRAQIMNAQKIIERDHTWDARVATLQSVLPEMIHRVQKALLH